MTRAYSLLTKFLAGVFFLITVLLSLQCNKSNSKPDPPAPPPPPPSNGVAVFTLQGSGGTCANIVVNGTYTQAIGLTNSNTISVQVNVTTIGTWSISTNTVNGIHFAGSGTFASTGIQTEILTGSGTPAVAGSHTFTITGGNTNCSFQLTTIVDAVGGGNGGGAEGITIMEGSQNFYYFYGGATSPIGANSLRGATTSIEFDLVSSGKEVKVSYYNANASTITATQTGSMTYLKPSNVLSFTSQASISNISDNDTIGKFYRIVAAKNGGNLLEAANGKPAVKQIVQVLGTIPASSPSNGTASFADFVGTAEQAKTAFLDNTNPSNPNKPAFKLKNYVWAN